MLFQHFIVEDEDKKEDKKKANGNESSEKTEGYRLYKTQSCIMPCTATY